LDLDVLPLALPDHAEGDRVARLELPEHRREDVFLGDVVAVDGGYDVAGL
jgi:hypothetical protein